MDLLSAIQHGKLNAFLSSAIHTCPHCPPSPLLIFGTSGGWEIVLSRPAFSLSPSYIDCSSLG